MKRVYAFGTFDGVHPGHTSYLRQAKAFGDHLTVVVARDINVRRIKGDAPEVPERQRLGLVRSLGIADEVILGTTAHPLEIFRTEPIDVAVLGYDQAIREAAVRAAAQRSARTVRVVRAKPYLGSILRTRKLKQLGWLGRLLRRSAQN